MAFSCLPKLRLNEPNGTLISSCWEGQFCFQSPWEAVSIFVWSPWEYFWPPKVQMFLTHFGKSTRVISRNASLCGGGTGPGA